MEPAVLGWVYWILRIVLLLFGERGRAVLGRLAPRLGRLNLTIAPQVPVNFAGEHPPYEMLSLLVSNQSGQDAIDTRCEVTWQRIGQTLADEQRDGAWMNTTAISMSSFVGPPDETRTLSSNGHPARLGLVVKYPGEANAYIVGRHNYISTTQSVGRRWAHPGWALSPGGYEVRLRFRSVGNKSAEVRLQLWNDGAQGVLRSDLAPITTI